MTTAPTDRDLASVLQRARGAVFSGKSGRDGDQLERALLIVDQSDLASLREAMRLAAGPGPHCMCSGDMELTITGEGVFERITLHHGYTLRWPGAWEWCDVALADPDAFAKWLAERGVSRYLDEHAQRSSEHARRQVEVERWITAVSAPIRTRVAALIDADYFALQAPAHPEVVAYVAALRGALGADEHVALALLRWYGSGVGRWSGFPVHETLPESMLEALGLARVLDAVMARPIDGDALSGLARYFAMAKPRKKRCREFQRLSEESQQRLETHVRTHHGDSERASFEAIVRRARQAREQRARAHGAPARPPERPHVGPVISPYLPFKADGGRGNRVLFRTIEDAEYYVMVGGSADEVLDVLLTPPRDGETMSMEYATWSRLRSELASVGRRRTDDPQLLYRLLDQVREPMDGHLGYIHRYGALIELARTLSGSEPTERGNSPPRPLDVAYLEFRAFVVAAVARRQSFHVVSESSLNPAGFPHRTRQRLARFEKARRNAKRLE